MIRGGDFDPSGPSNPPGQWNGGSSRQRLGGGISRSGYDPNIIKRRPQQDAVVAALILTAFSVVAGAQVVHSAEFKPDPAGMPGEMRYDRTVDVGRGIRLPVTVEVTARRNGTLKVANLKLRVLDEYDDGQVYEGGLLRVEFVDVTGDGLKDLVVTGIYVHTGEKAGGPATREPITSVYVFVPDKGEFRRTFHCGPEIGS